jgi:hypothetical protein
MAKNKLWSLDADKKYWVQLEIPFKDFAAEGAAAETASTAESIATTLSNNLSPDVQQEYFLTRLNQLLIDDLGVRAFALSEDLTRCLTSGIEAFFKHWPISTPYMPKYFIRNHVLAQVHQSWIEDLSSTDQSALESTLRIVQNHLYSLAHNDSFLQSIPVGSYDFQAKIMAFKDAWKEVLAMDELYAPDKDEFRYNKS